MLKVKRTGASDYGRFVKLLVVGAPGSGKTTLAGCFPNPLLAAAEPGLMSVADRDLPYVEIHDEATLLELKTALNQKPEVREKTFGFPVDTLVIDTFDEVQRILVRERLRKTGNPGMQMQDWGVLLEKQQSMVTGLRNLPMHVIITCHIKTVSDDESGTKWFGPSLQGGFADQIAEYVDISGVMIERTENVPGQGGIQTVTNRYFRTAKNKLYPFVKDRSDSLPSEMLVDRETFYDDIDELVFARLASMKDTVELDVDTGYEEPKPMPLPAIPQKRAATKKASSATPTKRTAKKAASKPAEQSVEEVATPSTEDVKSTEAPSMKVAEPTSDAEQTVTVLNKLPEGVEPKFKGHGTSFYCEECGDEVESMNVKNLSRVSFRKVLCQTDYDKRLNDEKKDES